MRDLFLNENQDIELDGRDLAQIEDDEELAQTVTNVLSIQLGEFEPEPEVGTDFTNAISKGTPDEIQDLEDKIDVALQQVPRISQITDIEADLDEDTRELSINLSLAKASDEDDEDDIEVGVALDVG